MMVSSGLRTEAQRAVADMDDTQEAQRSQRQNIAQVDTDLRVRHIIQKNRGTVLILVERLINGNWHYAGQEEVHLGHFIHNLGVSCNFVKERLLHAKMNDQIEVRGWNLSGPVGKE